VRLHIPYRAGDAWWGPEIEQLKSLIFQPDGLDVQSLVSAHP
jgi:hypothetical protein